MLNSVFRKSARLVFAALSLTTVAALSSGSAYSSTKKKEAASAPAAAAPTHYSGSSSNASDIFFGHSANANINQGNFTTGAITELTFSWFGNDINSQTFRLDLPVEYFVLNRLSVGGTFNILHVNVNTPEVLFNGKKDVDYTSLLFGPSATYHFFSTDKISTYLNTALGINILGQEQDDYVRWGWTLGANYYLLPSVAVGPSIRFEHHFGMNKALDENHLRFAAAFSLFL